MKRFLLGWFLIAAALGAGPASAGITPDVMSMAALGLSVSGTSGTFTYALNNATPTVQSAAINLTNYGAVFLQITATSGPNGVMVAWSDSSSGPFGNVGQIAAGIALPLKKMGNYLQLTAYGYIQPSNISGFTPFKPTVSAQYLPVAGETFTLSSGGTPIPVTLTATSYGAYLAGGANALSNNAEAVVIVGGPAGQQTMANSSSVTLASDQTAGALASSANQATGNASLSSMDAKLTTLTTGVNQGNAGSQNWYTANTGTAGSVYFTGSGQSLTIDCAGYAAVDFQLTATAAAGTTLTFQVGEDKVTPNWTTSFKFFTSNGSNQGTTGVNGTNSHFVYPVVSRYINVSMTAFSTNFAWVGFSLVPGPAPVTNSNLSTVGGSTTSVGAGTSDTGSLRVAVAADRLVGAVIPNTVSGTAAMAVQYCWTGNSATAQRADDVFKPFSNLASNPVGTIWTPASTKTVHVVTLQFSGDVAGNYTVFDSGGNTIYASFLAINAAGAPIKFTGTGYPLAAANNKVTVLGPSSSHVSGVCSGTEE